jgi:hypothetical protein
MPVTQVTVNPWRTYAVVLTRGLAAYTAASARLLIELHKQM